MADRFDNESSTYLRRYAHALIDWHPWTHEAFQKAQKSRRPVLVSIGYIGCRWCDKMDEESFADPKVAMMLNEHFVCIKVDAYQRPDIAAYFQRVFETMNKHPGGWPLTLCLSEEAVPFYAGAYLPPQAQYDLTAFPDLLATIIDKYRNDKARLLEEGRSVLAHLNRPKTSIQATHYDRSLIPRIRDHAEQLFDVRYGGFSQAPKFPQTSLVHLLLEHYRLTGDKLLREMLVKTLNAMAHGALRDRANGGFFHHVRDEDWQTPHAAKPLYTNALLARLYLDAADVLESDDYRDIAFETLDFMLRTMQHDGLFIGTIDTESSLIDEQIVTAFNAMAVSALFTAARLAPDRYLAAAQASLETLMRTTERNGILYHTASTDDTSTVRAFLDDCAYLGEALIEAYRTTLDETHLIAAQRIANAAVEHFYDRGFWHYARGDFDTEDKPHDLAYPSATATMVQLLQNIAVLVDPIYTKFVSQTLAVHSYDVMRRPLEMPKLTSAALRQLCGSLTIRGETNRLLPHRRTVARLAYPYIELRGTTDEGFILTRDETTLAYAQRFDELFEPVSTYRRRVFT